MADEEVLRLKATVIPDEAIASLRALGKELGLTGKNVNLKDPQKQFGDFKSVIVSLSREVKQIVPGLGMVGFTAAGVAAGTIGAIRGLKGMADNIVALKVAAREIGLSQRELRAFQLAAEKASIAPEAIITSLQTFAANALDIRKGFTNLRGELVAYGAPEIVTSIMTSTNLIDNLREAFGKLKDIGERNPQLARMLSGQLFGNPDVWRLSWDEFEEALRRQGVITKENEEAAKRYRDAVIDVGKAWTDVKEKMMGGLVGTALTGFLKDLEKILDGLNRLGAWIDKWTGATRDKDIPEGLGGLKKRMERELEQTPAPNLGGWWNKLFGPSKAGPTAQMGALLPGLSAMRLVMSTDIGGRSRFSRAVASGVDKYDDFLAWINSSEVPGQRPDQKSTLQRLHELLKPDFETAIDQILTWKNIPDPLMPGRQAMRYYFPSDRDQIKEGTKAGVLEALQEYAALEAGTFGGRTTGGPQPGGEGAGGGRQSLGKRLGIDTGMSRGLRNNNPGNLKYGDFAKAHGATGADDRGFAIFPDRETGEAAQKALIQSDAYRGLTLKDFAAKYAEGSPAWMRTVGAELGIGPNDVVNNMDPRLMGAIQKAEGTLAGPSGANYFERMGVAPLSKGQMSVVQTPYGRITVHPQAAGDFSGFYGELGKMGAPIGRLGSYAYRPKRWGGGLSAHGYGTATDLDDQIQLTPELADWIDKHPREWADLKRRYHMAQPLPRKDPGHVEWTGPGRIDEANGGGRMKASGTVNVTVHAPKGTKVSESHDGLWQESTVRNYRQMQPTESAGRGFGIEGGW